MCAWGWWRRPQNKIGTPVDQILLFCYHYDPATGKYGAIAMNMVRFARRRFRADRRHVSVDRVPPRLAQTTARRAGQIARDGSELPLFPEQASTIAPDVDHLLYFLLAVAVFFHGRDLRRHLLFRDPLPAALRSRNCRTRCTAA